MQIPAFKMSAAKDIAKLIVAHIIEPKYRSTAYKKYMKSMWGNKTGEKSKWTEKDGWGKDDENAPKIHYDIHPTEDKKVIPSSSVKNWAKIFVIEGAFETAGVFSAGLVEQIFSLQLNRDSYYKDDMAMKDSFEAKSEESLVKIFEVCRELSKKNAPNGLKNVMVKSKRSREATSLGSFFDYRGVKNKWKQSALGLITEEYGKLIRKGDNERTKKLKKKYMTIKRLLRKRAKTRVPKRTKKIIIPDPSCA